MVDGSPVMALLAEAEDGVMIIMPQMILVVIDLVAVEGAVAEEVVDVEVSELYF